MNADASDPASAATPTSRGTSSEKTWLRMTTTIPITIAGIESANVQRGRRRQQSIGVVDDADREDHE